MQPSAQLDESNVALILADGKKVLRDGRVITDVPSNAVSFSREIQSGRAASRTLQKMNPVTAVIFYTCVGLDDEAIATALQATEAQIATIKQSELYGQLVALFDRTVFDDARREAKHVIAKASTNAANRMVEAVDSDDPLISLSASREVLKLSGISTEQGNESKLSGLQIRITRREDEADEITIGVK